MKPEDGDWTEATPVLVKDTNCTIPRLKEGKKYQFRVKAVNELGPGEASKPTSPVVVETQPGMLFRENNYICNLNYFATGTQMSVVCVILQKSQVWPYQL